MRLSATYRPSVRLGRAARKRVAAVQPHGEGPQDLAVAEGFTVPLGVVPGLIGQRTAQSAVGELRRVYIEVVLRRLPSELLQELLIDTDTPG